MTIRVKLIAAFICITLIPALIITVFVTTQAMTRERDQFNQSSLKQMREVDNAFSLFLNSVAENVALLASTPLVRSAAYLFAEDNTMNISIVSTFADKLGGTGAIG